MPAPSINSNPLADTSTSSTNTPTIGRKARKAFRRGYIRPIRTLLREVRQDKKQIQLTTKIGRAYDHGVKVVGHLQSRVQALELEVHKFAAISQRQNERIETLEKDQEGLKRYIHAKNKEIDACVTSIQQNLSEFITSDEDYIIELHANGAFEPVDAPILGYE